MWSARNSVRNGRGELSAASGPSDESTLRDTEDRLPKSLKASASTIEASHGHLHGHADLIVEDRAVGVSVRRGHGRVHSESGATFKTRPGPKVVEARVGLLLAAERAVGV